MNDYFKITDSLWCCFALVKECGVRCKLFHVSSLWHIIETVIANLSLDRSLEYIVMERRNKNCKVFDLGVIFQLRLMVVRTFAMLRNFRAVYCKLAWSGGLLIFNAMNVSID
jgi:hypothetical protein